MQAEAVAGPPPSVEKAQEQRFLWEWQVRVQREQEFGSCALSGCREVQSARWVKLELWLLVSQGIQAG